MRKNRLLIVLFACIFLQFGMISCTYDYFEDERNYQVFVPGVLDNSITDCRVMVYTEDGVLVRERYAAYPWDNDPREQVGLFSFSLAAGNYHVYCYTNTEGVTFNDVGTLDTAAFQLKEKNGAANGVYDSPSDLLYQKFMHTQIHPGVLEIDTAKVTKYTGRITVRFKNFPADASRITHVELNAANAAVSQPLKTVTETVHLSNNDIMWHWGELPVQDPSTGYIEVDHWYFPTVDDGGVVDLKYKFLDTAEMTVITIPVLAIDKNTAAPLMLYPDQRLIIEVDAYTIVSTTIVGWDEDILNGGNTGLE